MRRPRRGPGRQQVFGIAIRHEAEAGRIFKIDDQVGIVRDSTRKASGSAPPGGIRNRRPGLRSARHSSESGSILLKEAELCRSRHRAPVATDHARTLVNAASTALVSCRPWLAGIWKTETMRKPVRLLPSATLERALRGREGMLFQQAGNGETIRDGTCGMPERRIADVVRQARRCDDGAETAGLNMPARVMA